MVTWLEVPETLWPRLETNEPLPGFPFASSMDTGVPSPVQVNVNCCPDVTVLNWLVNWIAEVRRGIRVVATRAMNLAEKCIIGQMILDSLVEV